MSASLAAFAVRRLLSAALFVLVVSAGTFLLARVAPGDATTDLQLSGATASTIEAARSSLGLDRPAAAHVRDWMAGLLRLDLGTSSAYHRPVAGLVFERLANTARLAFLALLVATALGLPLGIWTGARPRGVAAHIVIPISTALVSCPPIVGVLGLLFAAVSTGWLSTAPGAIALPTMALALPLAATLERLQSRAMADTLQAPDLAAARARGLTPARLIWLHAGRQSLRPVLGIYGLLLGTLLSGSLAVETITGWPGIGRLTFDALISRDLFLIAGCALAGAVLISASNWAADVLRAWIDPRVVSGS